MITFSWKIMSVNSTAGYMTVEYKVGDSQDYLRVLNMSIPAIGTDLQEYIKNHAPIADWARLSQPIEFASVTPGDSGVASIELPIRPEQAVVSGDILKAKLKALIQEVLDEQGGV